MAKDIESQMRTAVEALSRWVTSAPISHHSKEWREGYLKLDAQVRHLSMKLNRSGDEAQRGSEVQKRPQKS